MDSNVSSQHNAPSMTDAPVQVENRTRFAPTGEPRALGKSIWRRYQPTPGLINTGALQSAHQRRMRLPSTHLPLLVQVQRRWLSIPNFDLQSSFHSPLVWRARLASAFPLPTDQLAHQSPVSLVGIPVAQGSRAVATRSPQPAALQTASAAPPPVPAIGEPPLVAQATPALTSPSLSLLPGQQPVGPTSTVATVVPDAAPLAQATIGRGMRSSALSRTPDLPLATRTQATAIQQRSANDAMEAAHPRQIAPRQLPNMNRLGPSGLAQAARTTAVVQGSASTNVHWGVSLVQRELSERLQRTALLAPGAPRRQPVTDHRPQRVMDSLGAEFVFRQLPSLPAEVVPQRPFALPIGQSVGELRRAVLKHQSVHLGETTVRRQPTLSDPSNPDLPGSAAHTLEPETTPGTQQTVYHVAYTPHPVTTAQGWQAVDVAVTSPLERGVTARTNLGALLVQRYRQGAAGMSSQRPHSASLPSALAHPLVAAVAGHFSSARMHPANMPDQALIPSPSTVSVVQAMTAPSTARHSAGQHSDAGASMGVPAFLPQSIGGSVVDEQPPMQAMITGGDRQGGVLAQHALANPTLAAGESGLALAPSSPLLNLFRKAVETEPARSLELTSPDAATSPAAAMTAPLVVGRQWLPSAVGGAGALGLAILQRHGRDPVARLSQHRTDITNPVLPLANPPFVLPNADNVADSVPHVWRQPIGGNDQVNTEHQFSDGNHLPMPPGPMPMAVHSAGVTMPASMGALPLVWASNTIQRNQLLRADTAASMAGASGETAPPVPDEQRAPHTEQASEVAPPLDVDELAEQVSRIILRQLAVERERRGIGRWH